MPSASSWTDLITVHKGCLNKKTGTRTQGKVTGKHTNMHQCAPTDLTVCEQDLLQFIDEALCNKLLQDLCV